MSAILPQCTIVEETPNYVPPADSCEDADASLTLQDAQAVAWKSVDGSVNGPGGVYLKIDGHDEPSLYAELSAAAMYNSSRGYDTMINAGYYYLAHNFTADGGDEVISGDPFVDGLSTAPIYYNVYEYNSNIWVFNYYMWFAFNGCSNQWMVSQSEDNIPESLMYYLCNLGVHEGDWESLSVMVCKNKDGTSTPLAVKYNQHEWNQIFDCSKTTSTGAPQCNLINDTHPVGYIALNSHATYPMESANIPYVSIPSIPVLYNLRGLYLVDRTNKDDRKRWEPTPANVVLIPDAESIQSASDPSAWAVYAGRWGDSGGGNMPLEGPVCLDLTGTEYVECSVGTDPVMKLIGELMGIDNTTAIEKRPWYYGFANDVLKAAGASSGKGPKGPLAKDFWNTWVNASSPPIIDSETEELRNKGFIIPLCPAPDTWTPVVTLNNEVVIGHGWDLAMNFGGVVILFLLIAILLGVFFGTSLCIPIGRRVYMAESRSGARMAARLRNFASMWMVLFFAVSFMGYLMFGISHDGIITETLKSIVNTVKWETLTTITIAIGVVLVFVQLVTTMWCMVHHAYVTEKLSGSSVKDKSRLFIKNHGDGVFGGLVGVNFFVTMLVIWLWFYTIVLTSVWVFVGRACASTLGELTNGICVDLSVVGIGNDIACGPDFRKFCNNFERRTLAVMFWGSTCVTAASLLMLVTLITCMWQYSAYRLLDDKGGSEPINQRNASSQPLASQSNSAI